MTVTANGVILSEPPLALRDTPAPAPSAPRDVLPASSPAPEPSAPAPTYRVLAEQARQGMLSDPEFKKAYFAGDLQAKQKMETVCRILVSGDASEQDLEPLAKFAGITKPPPAPPAPPPRNPLERVDAKPADYRADFRGGSDPKVTEADVRDAREFAAALRMHPILGNSVLSHIAEVDSKVRSMSPHDAANWVDGETRALISHAGSVEKAEQMLSEAQKAISELGANTAWGKKANLPVWNSAWLVRSLSNFYRSRMANRGAAAR
jgi:hypothetical protein